MYGVGRSLDFRVSDLRCWEEKREKERVHLRKSS